MAKRLSKAKQQLLEQMAAQKAQQESKQQQEAATLDQERKDLSVLLENKSPDFDQRTGPIESNWSEGQILNALEGALTEKMKVVLPQLVEQDMLGEDLAFHFRNARSMDQVIFQEKAEQMEEQMRTLDESLNMIQERQEQLNQREGKLTNQQADLLRDIQEAKEELAAEKRGIEEQKRLMTKELEVAKERVEQYSKLIQTTSSEVIKGQSLGEMLFYKLGGQLDDIKIALIREMVEQVRQLNIPGLTDGLNHFMQRIALTAERSIEGMDDTMEKIIKKALKGIEKFPTEVLRAALETYPAEIREKTTRLIESLQRNSEGVLDQIRQTGQTVLQEQITILARENQSAIEAQLGQVLTLQQVEEIITNFLTSKLDVIEIQFSQQLAETANQTDLNAIAKETIQETIAPYLEADEATGREAFDPNKVTADLITERLNASANEKRARFNANKAAYNAVRDHLLATQQSGNTEPFDARKAAIEAVKEYLNLLNLQGSIGHTVTQTERGIENVVRTANNRILRLLPENAFTGELTNLIEELGGMRKLLGERQRQVIQGHDQLLQNLQNKLNEVIPAVREEVKAVATGFTDDFNNVTTEYERQMKEAQKAQEEAYQAKLAELERQIQMNKQEHELLLQRLEDEAKQKEEARANEFQSLKTAAQLQLKGKLAELSGKQEELEAKTAARNEQSRTFSDKLNDMQGWQGFLEARDEDISAAVEELKQQRDLLAQERTSFQQYVDKERARLQQEAEQLERYRQILEERDQARQETHQQHMSHLQEMAMQLRGTLNGNSNGNRSKNTVHWGNENSVEKRGHEKPDNSTPPYAQSGLGTVKAEGPGDTTVSGRPAALKTKTPDEVEKEAKEKPTPPPLPATRKTPPSFKLTVDVQEKTPVADQASVETLLAATKDGEISSDNSISLSEGSSGPGRDQVHVGPAPTADQPNVGDEDDRIPLSEEDLAEVEDDDEVLDMDNPGVKEIKDDEEELVTTEGSVVISRTTLESEEEK